WLEPMLSGTATAIATNAATIESLFMCPPLGPPWLFDGRGLPAPPSSASPLRGGPTGGSHADTLIRSRQAHVVKDIKGLRPNPMSFESRYARLTEQNG